MIQKKKIAIVGAGIAGASIAYHLAKRGIRDVIVLDQGELVSGTTSHAPGLVGQLRSSKSLTKMLMYSVSLYSKLKVNGTAGYFPVGGVRLASSRERLLEIKEQARFAAKVGLEAHLISAQEALTLFPLMDPKGVEGALWLPGDGSATPTVLAQALIARAKELGVIFQPHAKVTGLKAINGRICGVETADGLIEAENVVLAAGIWSALIGSTVGISLPLIPMQHQYAVTEPLPELAGHSLPNLRDPDNLVYLRQTDDTLVLGGYERNPRTFSAESIPGGANPTVLTFDQPRFKSLDLAARERVPCLGTTRFARQVNGLESFTPDGEFLLGPSSTVKGLWIACGFCAHGVSGAGGVGKVLADWIVDGKQDLDLSAMSPERFGAKAADARYVERGARRLYSSYYEIHRA